VCGLWRNTRANGYTNAHPLPHTGGDNTTDNDNNSIADCDSISDSDSHSDRDGNGDCYTITDRSSDQHGNAHP
jgi:hypothetical protein